MTKLLAVAFFTVLLTCSGSLKTASTDKVRAVPETLQDGGFALEVDQEKVKDLYRGAAEKCFEFEVLDGKVNVFSQDGRGGDYDKGDKAKICGTVVTVQGRAAGKSKIKAKVEKEEFVAMVVQLQCPIALAQGDLIENKLPGIKAISLFKGQLDVFAPAGSTTPVRLKAGNCFVTDESSFKVSGVDQENLGGWRVVDAMGRLASTTRP